MMSTILLIHASKYLDSYRVLINKYNIHISCFLMKHIERLDVNGFLYLLGRIGRWDNDWNNDWNNNWNNDWNNDGNDGWRGGWQNPLPPPSG